ncbi:MAG: tRNA pseudouridine synthase A [Deltaproteobacteria bacterium]|nr:tRNA pseudouridine synthase A [Deltaproteobacteria bacterium]
MAKDLSRRTQLLIRFGYDGRRFRGLQPQGPGVPTAGQALKERLAAAAGVQARGLAYAARTDAGVHALNNAATCYFLDEADGVALATRLAATRDDGLCHVVAEVVPPTIHARGHSRGKRYRYLVDDRCRDACAPRPFSWPVAPELSGERLRLAARALEGTHDFSSLRGGGCTAAGTVKTLSRVRVGGPFPLEDGRRWLIEIVGDAFLRKMVRNAVALLVEVGSDWRPVDDVARVLAARDRRVAGLCAPPEGLTLLDVGFAWPDDGSALIAELR